MYLGLRLYVQQRAERLMRDFPLLLRGLPLALRLFTVYFSEQAFFLCNQSVSFHLQCVVVMLLQASEGLLTHLLYLVGKL